MATYYKYAERSATSQVNWAEIGKNLTDTLQEENKIREEKKAAIDEASRQYGIALEKSPQSEDLSLNEWGLDYAAQAQEARLLQDRLLKSGKLKLRDYTMMRQNLTDGTVGAFSLIDEYNAELKVRKERANSMNPAEASQYLEQWQAEQAEGFSNFSKSKLYINPTNFAVSIGKNFVTKDGVTTMSDDPNDFTTVNELRNRLKTKYDKFDSKGFLKKRVDLFGKEIRETITKAATKSKTGFTTSEEDVRLKADFEAAQNQIINEAFANPLNLTSVLTDDIGLDDKQNQYTFTFNPTEKGLIKDGKNYIYMKKDEHGTLVPDFSNDQKETAKDYMKTQMNMMLNYESKMTPYVNPTQPQLQQWQAMMGQDKKAKLSAANMLLLLKNGTQEEVQAAVDYFRLVNPQGIKEIARWGDPNNGNGGVSYVDATGTLHELTRTDSDRDWITAAGGAFLGPDINLLDVVDQAIQAKGGTATWDDYGEIANRAKQIVVPTTEDASTDFFFNIANIGKKGNAGKYSK